MRVVRHEEVARQDALDERMAAVLDVDDAVRPHRGAHVVVGAGRLREAREHIDERDLMRRLLDLRQVRLDFFAHIGEEIVLDVDDLLLCAEDLRLEFLEFLRDVALSIRERLLADVAVRHAVRAAVAHLDVVAEDLVVADLQRLDARLLLLALLNLLQHRLAVVRDAAVLVELLVVARLDDAALAQADARVLDNRALQEVDEIIEGLHLRLGLLEHRRLCPLQLLADSWQTAQRDLERDEVARIGRADLDARQEALEVVDLTAAVAHAAAQREITDEFFDGIEALRDARDAQERVLEPLLQEEAAHRRLREVEDV